MYKIREYKNGVRLIYKKMSGVSSVSLGIWIDTGSRNEEKAINGVSHFLEHLVFKGSKNYSSDRIKESIEGIGGSLNAFTSEENTCYYAKFLGKHLRKVFDCLSDMALRPLFKKEDIEKERTVIVEEIKMYKDLPQYQVQEIFDELLWPEHPLGRNIAGSVESISGMGRRELGDYHRLWYSPAHIVVACAGDLDEERLERDVEKTFGRLDIAPRQSFLPFLGQEEAPRIRIAEKPIEQTHINLGFPSLNRAHKDRFALGLLHVVLGGNMSSRLFNEIREKKGLAYEIASHAKKLKDTGVFFVHAGIDNKNLFETTRLVFLELDRMRSKEVSTGELRRAKDYYISQAQMALDDTMDHMLWMGDSLTNIGYLQTKEEMRRCIERVTAKDILRLSREIIDFRRLRFAAVGPQSKGAQSRIAELAESFAA